jgi:hypothetical protein
VYYYTIFYILRLKAREINNNEKDNSFFSKNFRFALPIFVIIIGIFIYSLITSEKPSSREKQSIEEVKTLVGIPLEMKPVKMEINTYGTVTPGKIVSVSSEVAGKVIYTMPNLRNGIVVDKKTVLVKIDPTDYQIQLSKTETEIAKLNAQISKQEKIIAVAKQLLKVKLISLELEEKNLNRNKTLNKRKIVSSQNLEKSIQKAEETKGEYLTAEGDLKNGLLQLKYLHSDLKTKNLTRDKAKNDLAKCIIKSPISGRLENVLIETGEICAAETKFLQIVDDYSLEIPISISTEEASSILDFSPNQSRDYANWFKYDERFCKVKILWKNKLRKMEWWGQIVRIKNFDIKTRTVTAIIKPTEPVNSKAEHFPLVSGLYCRVTLTGREMKDAIEVPLNAIQLNDRIYLVGKDKRAFGRKVKILRYTGYQAVISSEGLKKGDYLITQNLPDGLINGTKVKVVKPLN